MSYYRASILYSISRLTFGKVFDIKKDSSSSIVTIEAFGIPEGFRLWIASLSGLSYTPNSLKLRFVLHKSGYVNCYFVYDSKRRGSDCIEVYPVALIVGTLYIAPN